MNHYEVALYLETFFEEDSWASHPDFPVDSWRYEVVNNDTRLGYREYLYNNLIESTRTAEIGDYIRDDGKVKKVVDIKDLFIYILDDGTEIGDGDVYSADVLLESEVIL